MVHKPGPPDRPKPSPPPAPPYDYSKHDRCDRCGVELPECYCLPMNTIGKSVKGCVEERLLREIFGPPADGTLILRAGGWTVCPFEHGDGFAITPPVVPQGAD